MFSLNRKLTSSTTVVESSMGEKQPPNSISPRPMCSQNSFHPFQRPSTPSPSSNRLSSTLPLAPNLHSLSLPKTSKKSLLTSRVIRAHKPHVGCSIIDNELRPHVPAAERIFSWHTPFSSRHQHDVAQRLPAPLVESAMMAVRGALAPNTKSTYAAGPLRFTQFCDKWNISEEARMPADYALLCAFIGEYKGLQSGNTIRSWLSGLRSWHIMNHAPWYGDDSWVHLARTSANKEGTKHKLALRAPVSIEHLSCLHHALVLSNPFHAAVWAVAVVTFFGCRRLGETTLTTAAALDPKYHVLRSTKFVSFPFDYRALHSMSLTTFLEFYFVYCMMVSALPASTFLGLNQQRNLGPLSSLLLAATAIPYALLLPSKTTLTSILLFLPLLPFLLTTLCLVNPKISSNMNFLVLLPKSGHRPCSPTCWATVSILAVLSNCFSQASLPKSSLLPGAGHPSPFYFIGTVWTKSYPCPPQKLTIKLILTALLPFLKNSVSLTKFLPPYSITLPSDH
jgi:hypothetical protein